MRLSEEAERRNQDLTEEDRERNLKWIVVGSRGEKRIIKATERDEQNSGQGGGGGSGNQAQIWLELKPVGVRKSSADQVIDRLRRTEVTSPALANCAR